MEPSVVVRAIAEVELFGPPGVTKAAHVAMMAHTQARTSQGDTEARDVFEECLKDFYDEVAKASHFKR